MDNITKDEFIFMNPRAYLKDEEERPLPRPKEYAWDWDKQEFKLKNGRFYFVYDKEAIKIWLWKLLQTPRFWYDVYNGDYGTEFYKLIGQTYTPALIASEAERYVREAVEYNLSGYVTSLDELEVDFDDGTLIISFIAITPYGEVKYYGNSQM